MVQSKVSSGLGSKRASKRDNRASGYSKGDAKREEILGGLMNALASGRLHNPSLRAIGQALEMEPAHILYYFGSRENLMMAVIVRWDEVMSGHTISEPPTDQFLDNYVQALGKNQSQPGIVHLYLTFAAEAVDPSHAAHDFIRERFERLRRNLSTAIQREQKYGHMADDINADIEARLLIALADGLQLQSLIDPEMDSAGHLRSAIEQLRTT